jgi:hypothetical protein
VNSTEIPTCQGGEINIEIETKKIKVIKVLQKQDHEIALANCINTTPAYLDENLSTEIIKNITLPTIDCNNITQISSIEKESYILFTDSNNINTINLATEYSPPYSLAKTNEDAYKLSDLSDITASQYNELPSIVTVPLSETAIVERSNNPFIPDEIGKYHIYISCYRTCEGNISKDRCSDYNDTNPDKPIAEYLVRGFWHYTKCEEEEENYCENNDVVEPAIAQIPLAPLNQKQTLQPIKIHPKTVVIGQTQKTTPSGGPGTELKKLLGMIGIKATEGCSCNSRAKTMDQWGPDLCEENISTIIDWLKQEAKKRGLPFVDRLAALIIKRAIRNARKNVQ